ncbi:hypothetical protein AB0B94_30920 [Micromonospora sp. NPDC048986]|uniref:hypothetical protein n=1 Tax=Micromonospora sp. NPDC048986 TaxID=3155644 RepID=UPI0033EDE9A6
MSTHPIDRIAAVIRRYPNNTAPHDLGVAIATLLDPDDPTCVGCGEVVADIIRKVNPNNTMGAGALAEAIWNDLTDEAPRIVRTLAAELDEAYGRS